MYPIAGHKFDAEQRQHCKDLLAEAERETLALQVVNAQQFPGKVAQAARLIAAQLSGIVHRE